MSRADTRATYLRFQIHLKNEFLLIKNIRIYTKILNNKMKVVWDRLIRFIATDGRLLRGEPILPHADFDIGSTTAETKLKAKVIVGDDIYDTTGRTKVTDEIVTVQKLLGPLAQDEVPILRCVGLNYAKHSMYLIQQADIRSKILLSHAGCIHFARTYLLIPSPIAVKEANRTPPPFPFIFFKPVTTITDHNASVVIPKIAQDEQADYEGELVRLFPFPITHIPVPLTRAVLRPRCRRQRYPPTRRFKLHRSLHLW